MTAPATIPETADVQRPRRVLDMMLRWHKSHGHFDTSRPNAPRFDFPSPLLVAKRLTVKKWAWTAEALANDSDTLMMFTQMEDDRYAFSVVGPDLTVIVYFIDDGDFSEIRIRSRLSRSTDPFHQLEPLTGPGIPALLNHMLMHFSEGLADHSGTEMELDSELPI